MLTLITLPVFKGTKNETLKALFITLTIDATIFLSCI